jgi:hypothetical protein
MLKRLLLPALLVAIAASAAPSLAAAPAAGVQVPFYDLPTLKDYLDLKKQEPALKEEELKKYESDLEGRADAVLKDLKLPDAETAKAEHVRKDVVTYYRFLRGWHDIHDAALTPLEKNRKANAAAITKEKESLMPFHKAFVDDLSSFLTPDQVDMVKDRMVSSKRMTVIYNGRLKDNPWMSDEVKAEMLTMCKEARENALDEGSAQGKRWHMDQLVGRLNNFVAAAKKKADAAAKPKP